MTLTAFSRGRLLYDVDGSGLNTVTSSKGRSVKFVLTVLDIQEKAFIFIYRSARGSRPLFDPGHD